MRRFSTPGWIALAASLVIGCSGRPAAPVTMVPPRIDLTQHEMIGVVEFETSSKGELGALATRRFTEAARADQGLVRMVEIDPGTLSRGAGGRSGVPSPEALAALGRERGVRTVVVGTLTVSEVRPDLRIATGLRSGSLSAKVDATLAVQLIEIATGASIWSSSARATRSVGQVSVFGGGEIAFDADDPENAYGGLVDTLVAEVTRDFRVRWEQR